MKLTLQTAINTVKAETVSVAEAAGMLGFSRQGVISLINRAALDAERIGEQYRISKDSVDRFAEDRKGRTRA